MANKDCVIIVLDVREKTTQEFKKKSIKYAADIIKDKICRGKKDCVGLVAFGTKSTSNEPNSNDFPESYLNITQYPDVQIPNWNFLTKFYQFVKQPACVDEGDWLEALVVAIEMLRVNSEAIKFQRLRIVLFHDFDGKTKAFDIYDLLAENIAKTDINLYIICSNVKYIDNKETGEHQTILVGEHKTDAQLKAEKYALDLISLCNAQFCNYENALFVVQRVVNPRPWTWNAKLTIGSKITIYITGTIAIKDESHIKLKKCWGKPEDLVVRETVMYNKGHEINAEPEELTVGYMLGGTPIAYDEAVLNPKDDDEPPAEPSLKFLGFAARETIPDEYFCGDSLYTIVHRKGKTVSAKKFDALVRAMLKMNMVMLCWKIYSAKFCKPKLVLLLPNAPEEHKSSSCAMVELSYHQQHHFLDFPLLKTKKSESNDAQVAAIDELIDSMDLTIPTTKATVPRTFIQKDLLPYDMLPHVYEQNVRDILERKVICTAAADDDEFQEFLEDKNFVEQFWKLPEPIEEKAKRAAAKVSKLFPLEKSNLPLEKAKALAATTAAIKAEINSQKEMLTQKDIKTTTTATEKVTMETAKATTFEKAVDIVRIGQKSPAEDFEYLLVNKVLPVKDITQRDASFHELAGQMRTVIWSLLFDNRKNSEYLEMERIRKALQVLRKFSCDFNAFDEYNSWMLNVKDEIIELKMYNFWKLIIVEYQLGLCIAGDLSLEEKLKLEEFYEICETPATTQETNDEDTMELESNTTVSLIDYMKNKGNTQE